MPDYKEMYLAMARETEKAIKILIAAQQKCEEQYIEAAGPEIVALSGDTVPKIDAEENSTQQ